MQEPAHSYPAAVEDKPEGAEEWADWAAVDMSSQVGMHISNDVKCEYKLANGKCAPKLGDELVLSPVTSLILMVLIGVPALFLVIVWAREPRPAQVPGADRCSLEGLMQVLLSATMCVCVCACMHAFDSIAIFIIDILSKYFKALRCMEEVTCTSMHRTTSTRTRRKKWQQLIKR
jgi:hypothetical protein